MNAMEAEVAKLDDLEIYYEREGTGDPLLLLHGATGCHTDWIHAGRDEFVREYSVIAPDARRHGASTNPQGTITHRQCAIDTFALLDRLGIGKCRAIGVSKGGNVLLHMATMEPDLIEARVVVSATMYFPEQARPVATSSATGCPTCAGVGEDAAKSQAWRRTSSFGQRTLKIACQLRRVGMFHARHVLGIYLRRHRCVPI
jgi:pimeloyl-ACP methyl ester carboxylesterase